MEKTSSNFIISSTSNYDYHLPPDKIAQSPYEVRSQAKLLVEQNGKIRDCHIYDLPDLLEAGDLLVVNKSRVQKARLKLQKETGGKVEVLVLPVLSNKKLTALIKPAKRVKDGTTLYFEGEPVLQVISPLSKKPASSEKLGEAEESRGMEKMGEAEESAKNEKQNTNRNQSERKEKEQGNTIPEYLIAPVGQYEQKGIHVLLEDLGEVPLPPYIHKELKDSERYQTVYSNQSELNSVAAPTAGLHLDKEVIDKILEKGVLIEELELAVGLATFAPIKTNDISEHLMHKEEYEIPAKTLEACQKTKEAGKRVIAVGTTVVRALESAALINEGEFHNAPSSEKQTNEKHLTKRTQEKPSNIKTPNNELNNSYPTDAINVSGNVKSASELFIRPGFKFQIVDALITNFHLPRSTLLVLLAAFFGEEWKKLYEHALNSNYKFLSFGDAMLVEKSLIEKDWQGKT